MQMQEHFVPYSLSSLFSFLLHHLNHSNPISHLSDDVEPPSLLTQSRYLLPRVVGQAQSPHLLPARSKAFASFQHLLALLWLLRGTYVHRRGERPLSRLFCCPSVLTLFHPFRTTLRRGVTTPPALSSNGVDLGGDGRLLQRPFIRPNTLPLLSSAPSPPSR
jgi:hypothetical protein